VPSDPENQPPRPQWKARIGSIPGTAKLQTISIRGIDARVKLPGKVMTPEVGGAGKAGKRAAAEVACLGIGPGPIWKS
jgi:hypothetical protein